MDNIHYIQKLESLHHIPGVEKLLGNINIYHPIKSNGKKYFYNLTLFEEFAGVKHGKKFNYTQLKNTTQSKLDTLIQQFSDLEEHLLADDILHEALEESITMLKLIKNGLDFELLKAGARIPLSEIEYANKLKMQEIYESELYGGRIIENRYESLVCFREIIEKYKRHKTRLKKSEQKQYKTFIKKISTALEKKGYNTKLGKKKSGLYHWQTKIFFKRYGKLPIKRELYTQIFRYSLDILGLDDVEIILTTAHGFSIGKKEFRIPTDSHFDEISVGKMFRLIYHEIVGHLLNWKNHQACYHNIRGRGSVMKEEGVSMLLESLMMGEQFQSIDLKPGSFSRILAGEILDGGDFRIFIRLRKKLSKGKLSTTTASFLRHKINYSRYKTGVQHKDVTYVRGLIQVMHFLKRGGNPQSLFSGKFGLKDIASGRVDFSDAPEFHAPFPIVDIIIYTIMTGNDAPKNGKLEIGQNFHMFLFEKYGPCFRMFREFGELSPEQNEKLLFMIHTVKARKLFGKHKITYQPIENMMIEHNRNIRNIIK